VCAIPFSSVPFFGAAAASASEAIHLTEERKVGCFVAIAPRKYGGTTPRDPTKCSRVMGIAALHPSYKK
jgi:hypothetical protein